jgi:proline racemase
MKKDIRCLEVVDVHVGGEVHRVVLDGVKPLPGESLREQAEFLEEQADGLRELLLHEPWGGLPLLNADLVVPPVHGEADAALLIMELMGYPLFSGSNTMATAIALIESGRFPVVDGVNRIKLETPGGLTEIEAECRDGLVVDTIYRGSSPAYVERTEQVIVVPGFGKVAFDVVWSGVFYAIVDASCLGFELSRHEESDMNAFGHAFVEAAREAVHPTHPTLGDVGRLSFAIFAGPLASRNARDYERRIAVYVHPSSLCRCSSGTGTTATMTQLAARGELKVGEKLHAVSWFDTEFEGTLTEAVQFEQHCAFLITVRSPGWVIARSQLMVDVDDPICPTNGLARVLKSGV